MPVPSLSIFFPAYNDAHSIPSLVRKTFSVLADRAIDFEVIVVNDGSQDETGAVLRRLAAEYGPRMRIVEHPVNRGYGAALRSGFAAATKELVFYTDGDGQYDVGELPLLFEKLAPGVGLVNGYKLERHDPWHRICIGSIYNRFARLLFGIRLRDIDCDFRLIRRELLQELGLESDTGTICVELVRKIELSPWKVVEVGVHHYHRQHGRSQFFRLRSLLSTLHQLLALYCELVLPPLPWIGRRKPCERILE
ncbi:MAG TPA: glycosyltransferase family 2 protein [Bryobacteraceae bacterium]|nr:glycosyltransferase family 2 protein [Bryobacteraceae bacterium]